MKITNDYNSKNVNPYIRSGQALQKNVPIREKEVKEGTEARVSDQVTLSPKGAEINRLLNLLEEIPDVREEKIAQIKEKIENGTYYVSGEMVAEKILVSSK